MMQPRDQLTAKEIRVATLVWEGLTNREIAKTELIQRKQAFRKSAAWFCYRKHSANCCIRWGGSELEFCGFAVGTAAFAWARAACQLQ